MTRARRKRVWLITAWAVALGCGGGGGGSQTSPPACALSVSTLVFGSVAVGQTKDLPLTITNSGQGTLAGTVTEGCSDYSIQGSASYSLGPGASTVVTIRFAPSASGARNCVLSVGGGCANVTCTGTGTGTALELDSGNIGPGLTYQHTFSAAGTFPYHCEIHPVMKGTVVVDPNSAVMSASVSIVSATATGFSPASVTVAPGATVTWTNNHTMTHTVTSD